MKRKRREYWPEPVGILVKWFVAQEASGLKREEEQKEMSIINGESPEGKELIFKKLQDEKSLIEGQFAMYRQKMVEQLRKIQEIVEKLIQETPGI